jgi:tetratricopeptide (TPR) repeat protein
MLACTTSRDWTYLWPKKYNEAIQDFNRAVELDPTYVAAWYRRGLSHYHLRNYPMAVRDFLKVVELEKDHADAYYQRSSSYKRMGKNRGIGEGFEAGRATGSFRSPNGNQRQVTIAS